jgi:hypothetical protein
VRSASLVLVVLAGCAQHLEMRDPPFAADRSTVLPCADCERPYRPTKGDLALAERLILVELQHHPPVPGWGKDFWRKTAPYYRQVGGQLGDDGHRSLYVWFFCDAPPDDWRTRWLNSHTDGCNCNFHAWVDLDAPLVLLRGNGCA